MRRAMLEGSQALAKGVQLTLGPGGRTVLIDPFEQMNSNSLSKRPEPLITKDGVTVAKWMNHSGRTPAHNIGAKLLIDAAERANEESGDGTTTCTVIARALIESGSKILMSSNSGSSATDVNFQEFKAGIQLAFREICKELDHMSIPVTRPEEIYQLAMVSSNHDKEIASILKQIYEEDPQGHQAISIGSNESYYAHPQLETHQGYSFSRGFLSPYFANNEKEVIYGDKPSQSSSLLTGAYVYVIDHQIETQQDLLRLQTFASKLQKPVLIMAPNFGSDALTSLVVNHCQGKLQTCAIRTPQLDQDGLMSCLHDVAAYAGAKVVTRDLGMQIQNTDPVHVVGKVSQAIIDKDRTILIGGHGDTQTQDRISFLENFIDQSWFNGF